MNTHDVVNGLTIAVSQYQKALDRMISGEKDPVEIARLYVDLKGFYDELDEAWKPLSALREKIAQEILPAAFEEKGVKTYTLAEGFRVTITPLVRASCRNMVDAIKWMQKHKEYKNIPKLTINASTLAALAKDLMEKGRELPDDLFNVHFGQNTSVTKVK